jgi:membrane-associated phospholipid phosphatase
MRSYFRSSKGYFIGLSAFFCMGIFLLSFYGKGASFKALNSYHPGPLNEFFINFTFMGDGIFALCLSALYLFYYKRKQQGLALLYAFLFSGIVVQIIKNLISAPRPRLFFEAGQYLQFIDGVSLANNSSFPSGHTTTAFAIATVMILLIKDTKWHWPILGAAILVGYSRIYLAQHFLLDVMIGAAIGTASGLAAVYGVQHGVSIKAWWAKRWQATVTGETQSSPTTMQPV